MHASLHPRLGRVGVFTVWISLSVAGMTAAGSGQKGAVEHVLAIGESIALPEKALTVTFEAVVEDSRCPTGVECIWEGDAAVRLRLDEREKAIATHVLHTSSRLQQVFEHGDVMVRLVNVAPHPPVDAPIRPQDYRITVTSSRK
jgi:hypothetical protein